MDNNTLALLTLTYWKHSSMETSSPFLHKAHEQHLSMDPLTSSHCYTHGMPWYPYYILTSPPTLCYRLQLLKLHLEPGIRQALGRTIGDTEQGALPSLPSTLLCHCQKGKQG